MMKYILLIIVLSAMAISLLYMKKKIQQRQFNQASYKNIIQVVDGVQVSMGNNMYLMKVGEEYILASVGQHGTSMIKMDQKEFKDPKEEFDEMFGEQNPNISLTGLKKKFKSKLSTFENK